MGKGDWPSKEVFICECFSTEHQLVVSYMPGENKLDYDELNFEVHLHPTYGFWRRVWSAIKYIFGYRSRYGNWDNFMVNVNDADKLITILQKFKDDTAKVKEANLMNGNNV